MVVTTAATFCATVVDEWIRAGVNHAVIAPGSRSTPLAIALAARAEMRIHLFHDERSASFAALGLALADGRPAILLCTSGTAAAHFHAAVIEANQGEVPMVVCTADRPPELRDVAAPQTIEQRDLYGNAVRWYVDPGVPDQAAASTWRSLGARVVTEACGPRPGPVHLNLPFRDPLVGDPATVPTGRPDGAPWSRSLVGGAQLSAEELHDLVAILESRRGVIVVGRSGSEAGAAAIHDLAEAIGWPVLADARSGCRIDRPNTVAAFDALLRHGRFAADHTPHVVLRIGPPPASKILSQWLERSGARQVQVHSTTRWIDAEHLVERRVVADVERLCGALTGRLIGARGTPWMARWRRADDTAGAAIASAIGGHHEMVEPHVALTIVAALPQGARLMVSSSMPIRDIEWFAAARDGLEVFANRGANGIDGVVSTAVGLALADPARPVAVLIGDVAFLHDSNGLLALADRDVAITFVVVDNDGGGIFSFLPQASSLPPDRFEQLFGTPHGVDIPALAAVHGIDAVAVSRPEDLADVVAKAAGASGAHLVHVVTDRARNVVVHEEINAAVRAALDTRPGGR